MGVIVCLQQLTLSCWKTAVVDLHDFNGTDGANPYGGPVLDANGNLFGTAFYGGTGLCGGGAYCGMVWEIAGVGTRHRN